MEDFNERKKEYFERLVENPRYIHSLLKNSEDSTRTLEIILDPKTENELSVAESLCTMFDDILYLMNNFYELKPNDLSSVEFVNLYSEMIIALKNDDKERVSELREIVKTRLKPEFIGKLMFQFFRESIYDVDALYECFCLKCGFDMTDSLSFSQFQLYFNKTNEVFNSMTDEINGNKISTDVTDEMASLIARYVSGFHDEFQKSFNYTRKI